MTKTKNTVNRNERKEFDFNYYFEKTWKPQVNKIAFYDESEFKQAVQNLKHTQLEYLGLRLTKIINKLKSTPTLECVAENYTWKLDLVNELCKN